MSTAFYSKSNEDAVRFDDPKINIEWPIPITIVSDKDKAQFFIGNEFQGVKLS
ncbi:dTDP-4-dehydrorhamnose 3,5-epimerase (dTDP-4-keto-6-deoxyglucose 3,5-epimerase) (dTDP-L-rhamnose synthetase) [Leadbettera azotonutricia ZAS-9]|uniref:dTDP-4-dehydrorhamnose 3,5-epimerase n=2 Tax=Leadbettera azotonutricia TaxID=150829 RepID=F5YB14_LEAAZ|nr:dTDP-4-dehydrorhamnose 3,5-epimerase (dTDP-4-keto-6-deoxyglucose 3,5-epimerase) (dTDP-L-rhamnose synthetase) [Leadbettera azotonutricia ZAS-9]